MKTLLTPVLLDYLIGRGYHYFLIKANHIRTVTADMMVVLTPVKERPATLSSCNFDACFDIDQEPVEMAQGLDNVISMVEINPGELPAYISFFMERLAVN